MIYKICPICKTQFDTPDKSEKKYCSRKCSNNDPAVIEKIKASQEKTYQEKYGGHPMKTDKTKNNFKKAMFLKYGVEHALKNEKFIKKVKTTKKKKYGDANYCNVEKIKKTKIAKYGQLHHESKLKQQRAIERIMNPPNMTPLFSKEEIIFPLKNKKYSFQCNDCKNITTVGLINSYIPSCKKCNNLLIHISTGEKEITEYLATLLPDTKIISSDKKTLKKREIDILLPEKLLAIEFNGIFWHSERQGKDRNYHVSKVRECMPKGIKMIHIFDYQWIFKKEIVKSMLCHAVGKTPNKIHARSCKIQEITSALKQNFIEDNHIHGDCKSSINIGLFYKEELIGCMTFIKSRYEKNFQWELARMVFKKYHYVPGGVTKLFTYFIRTYDPSSIISYTDRCWGFGNVYIKVFGTDGRKPFAGFTKPNYYYFKDLNVYSRQAFQKHMLSKKLDTFNSSLSEWENMKKNGYNRFWDCGNMKFIWKKKRNS